jgi:AraC family transcriptional regulator
MCPAPLRRKNRKADQACGGQHEYETCMSAIVEKALWYIEHRYGNEVGLDDVADHIGVSRFHLSRSFPAATGMSISAYLRGRRLTEAAKALAGGAPDILSVALDACYGSHEAFTRAFRYQFGVTPEQVRARGELSGLRLIEAIRYDSAPFIDLAPPLITEGRPLLIAGLMERHDCTKPEEVPAQWQRFTPYIESVPNGVGMAAYGVLSELFSDSDSFNYLSGLEVSDVFGLDPALSALRLPAQRYAAFKHPGHVSSMRSTIHTIFNREIGALGLDVGDLPNFIEYYGPGFDPEAGEGDVEIWVPLGS